MKLIMRGDISFESFKNMTELKKKILFIFNNNNINNILYKGDPFMINHKLLKKILPIKPSSDIEYKFDINMGLREQYNDFLKKNKIKYCLIYKEQKN